MTQGELDEMDRNIHEEVDRAVRFADESPEPALEELYTDIYANPLNIDTAKGR